MDTFCKYIPQLMCYAVRQPMMPGHNGYLIAVSVAVQTEIFPFLFFLTLGVPSILPASEIHLYPYRSFGSAVILLWHWCSHLLFTHLQLWHIPQKSQENLILKAPRQNLLFPGWQRRSSPVVTRSDGLPTKGKNSNNSNPTAATEVSGDLQPFTDLLNKRTHDRKINTESVKKIAKGKRIEFRVWL